MDCDRTTADTLKRPRSLRTASRGFRGSFATALRQNPTRRVDGLSAGDRTCSWQFLGSCPASSRLRALLVAVSACPLLQPGTEASYRQNSCYRPRWGLFWRERVAERLLDGSSLPGVAAIGLGTNRNRIGLRNWPHIVWCPEFVHPAGVAGMSFYVQYGCWSLGVLEVG